MIKTVDVRQEFLYEVRQSINFWKKAIEYHKSGLTDSRNNMKRNQKILTKLEARHGTK